MLNRFILRSSYPLRFYLDSALSTLGNQTEGIFNVFDQAQAELEMGTEALSNRIARKRLNSPRREVVAAALQARQIREQFNRTAWTVARYVCAIALGPRPVGKVLAPASSTSTRSLNVPLGFKAGAILGVPLHPRDTEPQCPICTFDNLPTSTVCEMCQNPLKQKNAPSTARPVIKQAVNTKNIKCKSCTFLNPKNRTECEMCQSPLGIFLDKASASSPLEQTPVPTGPQGLPARAVSQAALESLGKPEPNSNSSSSQPFDFLEAWPEEEQSSDPFFE